MLCLNCEGDLSKLQDSPRVFICGDCYDIIKKTQSYLRYNREPKIGLFFYIDILLCAFFLYITILV